MEDEEIEKLKERIRYHQRQSDEELTLRDMYQARLDQILEQLNIEK